MSDYKKKAVVVVIDKDGKKHKMSVANSFDMINNCGWKAMGTEPPKADPAAEALAATEAAALEEGQAIADALNKKSDTDAVKAAADQMVSDSKIEKAEADDVEKESIAKAAVDKKAAASKKS